MQRITCDIDSKSRIKICYYTIKSFVKVKKIDKMYIGKSHSGNYHIEIWTKYPYKIRELFYLREILGDDKYRLKMDKQRKWGRNTLFYKKEPIDILR